MIRLVIVDDHEMVRKGLNAYFANRDDIEVVGEATDGESAVEMVLKLRPDVVLMDVRMPNCGGVEACRKLKELRVATKILMLTSYSEEESVTAAILAGADGYVLKQVDSEELVDKIHLVAQGKAVLDSNVTTTVFQKLKSLTETQVDAPQNLDLAALDLLSDSEKKILAHLAKGKTNKQIAEALYLSDKTVRNYVSNILAKLNLNNRSQVIAVLAGLEEKSWLDEKR